MQNAMSSKSRHCASFLTAAEFDLFIQLNSQFGKPYRRLLMKHQLNRLLSFATSVLLLVSLGSQAALAQYARDSGSVTTQAIANAINSTGASQQNLVAHSSYTQLFTYDPSLSGTVSAYYVSKSHRLAALLVQPHSVVNTACGFLFQGLQGLPLSTLTFSIDLSNDTKVTNKAVWILVGVDNSGNIVSHTANSENFSSKYPSGPGWTTYTYSANTVNFFSPSIVPGESLSGFVLALLGGEADQPDHFDHWASRPAVNGSLLRQILRPTVNLNGTGF
jgi:hypothetical protein